MEGIDPDILLEWLQTGIGEERDLQLTALEQLCMLLLIADNIDRCFESCPPRTFIPALCKIFLDETAPDNVLEVTARAITYYLDLSNECTRRITQVEGAVKAICTRLEAAEMTERASKDLAEQCVKLLERVCQRETMAVYDAGGINAMLALVRQHGVNIHKDTMYSAMSVVTRLCSKMEPTDSELPKCAESLGALLEHDDAKVSESALRCFAALTDRFIRKMMDPAELVNHSNLIDHLLITLTRAESTVSSNFLSIVLSVVSNLCRGSSAITEKVLSSPKLDDALQAVLTNKEERVVTDGLRLADLLLVLLCDGRSALPFTHVLQCTSRRRKFSASAASDLASWSSTITESMMQQLRKKSRHQPLIKRIKVSAGGESSTAGPSGGAERAHRHLIDAIRQKDLTSLVDAVETGQIDVNFTDDVGQTLCNWASAFGSIEMVHYLCDKGADVNKGQKSSSLHYAACFGRPDIVKLLLQRGANPDLRDEDGKTALDRARERSDEDHNQAANILESPSVYMHSKDETKPSTTGSSSGVTSSKAPATSELPNRELVKKVLNQLLPLFCEIFQKSLTQSVRRTSLSLLRKIVENIDDMRSSSATIEAMDDGTGRRPSVDVSPAAENLVSVVVSVLDQEDNLEGQEQVMMILTSLLQKDKELWVAELVRLGVFERIEAMACNPPPSSVTQSTESYDDWTGAAAAAVRQGVLSRSTSSTPSVAIETDIDSISATPLDSIEETARERISRFADTVTSITSSAGRGTELSGFFLQTPPPTVELGEPETPAPVAKTSSSSSTSNAILNVVSKLSGAAALSSGDKNKSPAKTILNAATGYRWKEWRLVRNDSALYIWSDVLMLELPSQSNGWFRYLADNEVHTVINGQSHAAESSMSAEEKTAEKRDLVGRWRDAARVFDSVNCVVISVLGIPSASKKLEAPGWELWSSRTSELQFKPTATGPTTSTDTSASNTTSSTTVLKDDTGSFVVETSIISKKLTVTPESSLPTEFHTGWSQHGTSARRIKFRNDIQKRKVKDLAWNLWNEHLKEAQAKPREALIRLENASKVIEKSVATAHALAMVATSSKSHVKSIKQPRIERVQDLVSAMKTLHESVMDDRRISTFEFGISGIVQAMCELLTLMHEQPTSYPASIFKETFSSGDGLSRLALKMVAVLEASEKFPQYLYDTPGGTVYGLQQLSKRVRTKLELGKLPDGRDSEALLLNKTGKVMKVEPLAPVSQIKAYLLRLVAKQWHDRERISFRFVKQIQDAKNRNDKLSFRYTSDFDDQGILYWLGTNARTVKDWVNPATINLIKITSSDARQPFGKPEDIISRESSPINCHSSDDKNAHFTIDFGLLLIPTAYTLRHARGYGRSALRNWLLQGSKDAKVWELIHAHTDDPSLGDPGTTATWHFDKDSTPTGPYRYLRIAQNGKNSSGQTHYLSLSGFEVYGDVVDVITESFAVPEVTKKKKKERPSSTSTAASSLTADSKKSKTSGRGPSIPTGAAASVIVQHIPQATNNNKLRAGLSVETVAAMQSRLRHRMSRKKQSAVGASSSNSHDLRGMRVVRGKDWRWIDQDGGAGNQGKIVSAVESGWVDVMWDNGHMNSYRYGADGHFDIERVQDSSSSSSTTLTLSQTGAPLPASVLESVRSRSRAYINMNRMATASANASGGNSSPQSALSSFASGLGFTLRAKKHHAASTTSAAASPLSRFSIRNTAHNPSTGATTSSSSSGSTSSNACPAVNIGKKSMSTTNLVDSKQKNAVQSVSTTNQAASAESLQHQTPSLENLLARAKTTTFGRIAENQEEDDQMMGEESDSASIQSGTSSAADVSMTSSQSEVSTATTTDSNTPREAAGTPSTPREGEKYTNLSVSAPDLAAARQRQQSSDTVDTEKRNTTGDEDDTMMGEEEDDAEDEDDEESANDDDDDDKDDDEEEDLSDFVMDALQNTVDNERGFLDKIREVFAATDDVTSRDPTRPLKTSTTSVTAANTTSNTIAKKKTFKAKLGGYADVLKGLMQTMMDPSSQSMEMDELMDDEDDYPYSDDWNEDPDEELAALGVPDSFVNFLSAGGKTLNWKHLISRDRSRSSRHNWEDELLVKCTYPSLIAAYDPRPGRPNVNQTLDIELPSVVQEQPKNIPMPGDQQLRLFLRGPNVTGVQNVTVEMSDDESSIFHYMQQISNAVNWPNKADRTRRILESTYNIIYEDVSQPTCVETTKIPSEREQVPRIVNQCLEVIGLLSQIGEQMPDAAITPNVFISDKLTLKLTQELTDALVVASQSLPEWCSRLVYTYPCLFSTDVRKMYLQATAFGVSRTIIWLQQRRDTALERARAGSGTTATSSARPHDRYHEYRVGRLRHERVKVTRADDVLLDQAIRLMKFHADRKAILEIEYNNEEGTGLGPTLEFYALVAAEMQRKALAIWVCDDDEMQPKNEEKEVDLGEGKKPAGYYVRRPGGLFPAPLPPHTDEVKHAAEVFRILGIFLAKVLQDGRLVDLPLSRPFLKLLVHPSISQSPEADPERILTLDDFEEVNPVKGSFLKELRALAQRKRAIENEPNLDQNAKRRKIGELKLQMKGTSCRVEDLALSFTVNPPSKVFKYEEMELVEGGAEIDVTMDNVEQYVEKCEDFYLNSGIAHQMRAFREGFDRVFPLCSLRAYSPEEVQRLLSGEQCPEWTREDVINFTDPKLGYTRESPGFLRFVDVMVGFNGQERKNFLQFATGCSSLPPGGLANLHPRLTIVRKVESGDGSYPSVNTCVHYLKLPEYSSAEILRERILVAITEKGFHLN